MVFCCNPIHVRTHTRTAKHTTLHHPSMHSGNDTNPKHNKSLQFRSHLLWMRSVESLLVNKGMGHGSSWSSLDLETLESDVSSGKSAGAIAKVRGWPSRSVCQRVAALEQGDHAPRLVGGVERRLTPEVLDEMREFIEEEHGRISVRSEGIRSQKALLSVCCACAHWRSAQCPMCRTGHIRDRRNVAEEMLARLVLASARRISRKISSS